MIGPSLRSHACQFIESFGESMKSNVVLVVKLVAITLSLSIVGCSSPSEPSPKPTYFVVDTATGYTTIDSAGFKAMLLGLDTLPDADVPELVVCQEFAEACEEMVSEATNVPSAPQLNAFIGGIIAAQRSQEDAMQAALVGFKLKEALPENSSGTFADPETDAAWDAAIGSDNKLTDSKEALHAIFRVQCFTIKELKAVRVSATSEVGRTVADVMLAATKNHLMATMRACALNQFEFPQATDIPEEEVEELRVRSSTSQWYTPY